MWQGHGGRGDGRSSAGSLARELPLRPISFFLLGFLVTLGSEGRKPRKSFCRGLENLVQVLWVLGGFLEGGLGCPDQDLTAPGPPRASLQPYISSLDHLKGPLPCSHKVKVRRQEGDQKGCTNFLAASLTDITPRV